MNVTLRNVKQLFPNGDIKHLDLAFVNGTTILYVHLPRDINPVKHLNEYVRSINNKECNEFIYIYFTR